MKSLVTGGAGFIGSHLAERLLEKGDEVIVLDNLSTGRLENVSHLQGRDDFELRLDTILDEAVVRRAVADSDRIFHLAAAVGVKFIIDNPLESIEVNVQGTENILHAANQDKKPVFLASTSEVYGKNENVPFREDDDRVLGSTTISRWSYSCTKALDEFLALAFWREKRLPVVIGRFFNTVGPRQTGRYGMVIPRFVKQALLGRDLTVHGTGEQTRAFMDVKDAVSAILALMENDDCFGQVFNVGGEKRISIKRLAETIKKKVGSDSEIKYIPYEEAYEEGFEDMIHRAPDISKINEYTGFKPENDTSAILDRVIDYFRSNEELI